METILGVDLERHTLEEGEQVDNNDGDIKFFC